MDDRIRNEGSPDTTERMPPAGETPSTPSMPPPPPSYGGSIPPPPPGSMSTTPPPSGTPGWSGPVSAQSGWVPPAAGYNAYAVPKANVTGLAKLGALFLIVSGVLIGLVGVLLVVAGRLIRDALGNQSTQFGDVVVGLAVGVGIFLTILMVIQVLAGIFAWRGAGFARFLGALYGVILGLLFLAGVTGGSSTTTTDGTNTAGTIIPTAIFAIGYLYTAIVFMFRWKSRPGG